VKEPDTQVVCIRFTLASAVVGGFGMTKVDTFVIASLAAALALASVAASKAVISIASTPETDHIHPNPVPGTSRVPRPSTTLSG
jgi:hypothetical protein